MAKAKGAAALGGNSLHVEADGADWYLVIRRADSGAHSFSKFNRKAFGTAELASLLPNHASASWERQETLEGADACFAALDGAMHAAFYDRTRARSAADVQATLAALDAD